MEEQMPLVPTEVGGVAIAEVIEEWRIVDRWWTDDPLRREYMVVRLVDESEATLKRDDGEGSWETVE